MRYAFIEQELRGHAVERAREALGVSVAGYHAWKARPQAPRRIATCALGVLIKRIFLESGKTHGAPRVCAVLKDGHGYTGSMNRIERLMREAGPRAKARRRFKATTDSGEGECVRIGNPVAAAYAFAAASNSANVSRATRKASTPAGTPQ